jgi:P27 family predicted phage terminase small subunit
MAGYKGKQGRKPVPTALKLVTGNPGKRPLNRNEPNVAASIPRAPAALSERARKEWYVIAHQLAAANLLTELDKMALAGLVSSYVRWMEAQEGIAKTGLLVQSRTGIPALNPLLKVSRDAQAEYTRLLGEFGLTPSSRSRIHVEPKEEDDEFEALMRRKGGGS